LEHSRTYNKFHVIIAAGLLLNNAAAVGGFVVVTVRVGDED